MIKKSQAILITVSILAILSIVGFSLLIFSIYELHYSRVYLDNVKAQYLAEAGLSLGKEFLKVDKKNNSSDSLEDFFYTHLKGQDVDMDNDGVKESRRFEVRDSQGRLYGWFALQIQDEASKFNLNSKVDGLEISIEPLLSSLGISRKSSFGGGFGKDKIFLVPEQVLDFLSLPASLRLRDYFTTFSRDREEDGFGRRRAALNGVSGEILLNFLYSGVSSPFQKAANFIDFQDEDLSQTVLDKFYKKVKPSSCWGGSFRKRGDYFYALAGGDASTFKLQNLGIPDGEYFCYFHSPFEDLGVGYVSSQEVKDCDVYNGEGLYLPLKVQGGELEFKIKPFENKDCALESIELISLENRQGLTHLPVRGREPIVINEIMVKPSREFSVDKSQSPGGSWVWKGGYYENNNLGSGSQGEGKWVFSVGRRGYFYVRLFANKDGGYIGDVIISGSVLRDVRDGMVFPRAVYIDGELLIKIQNNSLTETSTFKGIVVSQEPDAEFIEILNLSPQSIDISNFSLEMVQERAAVLGWPAIIPQGTIIKPYQHLILAIDKDDSNCPSYLKGNGISFLGSWGLDAVQLKFSGNIEGSDDVIPNGSSTLILKNPQGEVVDIVEYSSSQIRDYASLERSDPTLSLDRDGDGIFDGWFISEDTALATPARQNNNSGTKEINPQTLETFYHEVKEQTILNQPLKNIAYAEEIPSGFPWKKFSLRDISLLADRFTSSSQFLGLDSFVEGSFKKQGEVFLSSQKDEWGLWRFSNIPSGNYFLKILARQESHLASVAVRTNSSEDFHYLGPFYFKKGLLYYGKIEVEREGILEVKVKNEEDSPLEIINFVLEPKSVVRGRINVNTAKKEVLSLLTSYNSAIISQRPFGEKTTRRLGIGDLLESSSLGQTERDRLNNFKLICPFITTRSDVYEIVVEAEYQGLRAVKHRLDVIVERE